MKQFIKHRVNSLAELELVDPTWGVEIDLRSKITEPGSIHLSHDPWNEGIEFRSWLQLFKKRKIRGPIVLNTKEDGLEDSILELMREFEIPEYFFIDTAPPTLVKRLWKGRDAHFAPRISKYEFKEALLDLNRGTWLWVDCFDGIPLEAEVVKPLKATFKICLVSPELHGAPLSKVQNFNALYEISDAICTKNPEFWLDTFR